MNYEGFSDLLENLFSIFRQNPPNRVQAEIIYQRVRHIPEPAMVDIFKYIEDTCDNIPRNLPKAIKAGWNQWMESHPERIERNQRECAACGGDGHLIAYKDGYSWAFRCGHCDNWQGKTGDAMRLATVNQIMDAGYYFKAPPKPDKAKMSRFIRPATLEKMVNRLGATLAPEPAYKEHDDYGNVYPYRKKTAA